MPDFTITNYNVFDSDKMKTRRKIRLSNMVSSYELEFYTEDCEGGHWLDGVYYPVRKGACFLAKPGQQLRAELPYKCCFLNIRTEDQSLRELLDGLPSYFMMVDYQRVVEYLHTMVALEAPKTIAGQLQVQSYACRILARLERYRQMGSFNQRGTVLHRQNLLMIDRYIREHLSEDLSVERLAQMCNLDATYFHKLYTAAFGITPAKRILGFRISAAKRGLIAGRVSLGELALQCGFTSQSYFCYRFKKETGMTPLEYRDAQLGMGKDVQE